MNTDPSVEWVKVRQGGVGRLDPVGITTIGSKVRLYTRVSDLETSVSSLSVSISYKPQGGEWTTEAATYRYKSDWWYLDWVISMDAVTGLYDIKADVEDPDGGYSTKTETGEFRIVA